MLSSRLAVCDVPSGVDAQAAAQRRALARISEGAARFSPKHWAQVLGATLLVIGGPVAIVWWLRGAGAIASPILCVVLGMALSLGASRLGRLLWEKRRSSGDLLFGELMLWGFLHRRFSEHRLTSAMEMLGPMAEQANGVQDVSGARRQAKLLERLAAGIETRDPYLHGHSRRVARHSWMIARRMGLSGSEVARIRTAAAVHDVGKVNTPTAILHKPGRLTDDEYAVIKRHAGDGAEMSAVLGDAQLTAMVRHHHERLDGSGYPDGLRAQEISLGAKIIAVADTFDAITSARPYRPTGSHRRAMDILKAEAGSTLDAGVVSAFCSHYAGRRPFVLSGLLSGLPERALSWLGGGVGSVASAGQALVVAAIVGGVAAAPSSLAQPAAKHEATKPPTVSAASPIRASRARALPTSLATVAGAHKGATGPDARTPRSTHGAAASSSPAPGASAVAAGAPQPARAVSGPGGGLAAVQAPNGSTRAGAEAGHAPGLTAHGREAARAKGQQGQGKGHAPPGRGQEAHGKSEEAHGHSEEAHGKSEEPHGKSEEAPSGSQAPRGNSEEAPGKSGESSSRGKSEEAHANNEEARGKSEETHGHG